MFCTSGYLLLLLLLLPKLQTGSAARQPWQDSLRCGIWACWHFPHLGRSTVDAAKAGCEASLRWRQTWPAQPLLCQVRLLESLIMQQLLLVPQRAFLAALSKAS